MVLGRVGAQGSLDVPKWKKAQPVLSRRRLPICFLLSVFIVELIKKSEKRKGKHRTGSKAAIKTYDSNINVCNIVVNTISMPKPYLAIRKPP